MVRTICCLSTWQVGAPYLSYVPLNWSTAKIAQRTGCTREIYSAIKRTDKKKVISKLQNTDKLSLNEYLLSKFTYGRLW